MIEIPTRAYSRIVSLLSNEPVAVGPFSASGTLRTPKASSAFHVRLAHARSQCTTRSAPVSAMKYVATTAR